MPVVQAAESQFYQPLLGRDPSNGRRVLYVILRTQSAGNAIAMHVRVFAVWYESRNDLEFAALSPIRGVDVYAAVLDDALKLGGVSRLTPETQRADRPRRVWFASARAR